ncbi:MAG TPA: hypothetical protein VFS43_36975 [Polyangiaceae bacterium]|nr:hypothetical protein [Polyangiaceae bacterium]
MARSYSTPSLVSLPHLSAPNAVALSTRLLTVADDHRAQLTLPLAKAAERLSSSVEALRASRVRLEEVKALDPSAALAADVRVDAACGAFHGFLQGWARLPSPGPWAEKAAMARRLLDKLYPFGLGFTQAPFVTQWAEVQKLLDRADLPEHTEPIRVLGGETFVEAIRDTFEAYGEALQVTKRRAEVKAGARVREPLDALVTSLRSYVLRVTAHADAGDDLGDPAARSLAEALLAPLVAWHTGGARKEKAAGEPGGEAGPEGGEDEAEG